MLSEASRLTTSMKKAFDGIRSAGGALWGLWESALSKLSQATSNVRGIGLSTDIKAWNLSDSGLLVRWLSLGFALSKALSLSVGSWMHGAGRGLSRKLREDLMTEKVPCVREPRGLPYK